MRGAVRLRRVSGCQREPRYDSAYDDLNARLADATSAWCDQAIKCYGPAEGEAYGSRYSSLSDA